MTNFQKFNKNYFFLLKNVEKRSFNLKKFKIKVGKLMKILQKIDYEKGKYDEKLKI